jgi:hypothetical protein
VAKTGSRSLAHAGVDDDAVDAAELVPEGGEDLRDARMVVDVEAPIATRISG